MKKVILLFALAGMAILQSCTKEEYYVQDDGYDSDTISEVWEYTNVDFTSTNNYTVILGFPQATYTSDMVLVYRLAAYDGGGVGDIWKPLPETYFFPDGTLDFGYSNDFSQYDTQIVLSGYDLPTLNDSYKYDQIFRVVVIPGYFGNKMTASVDFSDYNAVIEYYHIDDSNVTKIPLK
ncbi:hypothetical protein [Flavobacterium sediminis]|nr:hypothetical protein [Flavobacterium sediminis]